MQIRRDRCPTGCGAEARRDSFRNRSGDKFRALPCAKCQKRIRRERRAKRREREVKLRIVRRSTRRRLSKRTRRKVVPAKFRAAEARLRDLGIL